MLQMLEIVRDWCKNVLDAAVFWTCSCSRASGLNPSKPQISKRTYRSPGNKPILVHSSFPVCVREAEREREREMMMMMMMMNDDDDDDNDDDDDVSEWI